MTEPARLYAVDDQSPLAEDAPTLLLPAEQAWVTETPTGLMFAPNTPRDIWAALTTRLTRQHKRIEWALGDAINFGEAAYGSTYDQWVEQTGLAESTLATIRWVAEKIEPSRRREDVGWSHHREVAPLAPAEQDRLLDLAADRGMTRWEVRQAVKVEQEKQRGKAETAEGESVCAADLPWRPGREDLTDDARIALDYRLAEMGQRHTVGFAAGFVAALRWADIRDAFTEWKD